MEVQVSKALNRRREDRPKGSVEQTHERGKGASKIGTKVGRVQREARYINPV